VPPVSIWKSSVVSSGSETRIELNEVLDYGQQEMKQSGHTLKNKNSDVKNVLIWAVSTTWLFRIISAANGIIAMPIVIGTLGKTEYGIWAAIGQTASFLQLTQFGIGNAVGRLVARCRGLGNGKMLSEVYSTATILICGSAILAAVLVLALSPWIGNILKLDESYAGLATRVFLIIALSQVVQLPMKLSVGVLTGHQLYGPHTIGKILTILLHLSGVLILFFTKHLDIVSLATVHASAAIVGQSMLMIVAWRLTGPWNISISNFSKRSFKELTSIGSSSLVTTMGNIGYRAGLSILLARMVNINAVGIYNVALTILENIRPLISSLSTPFSTIASELQAKDQFGKLRQSANAITTVTFAVSIGLVVFLYFYSIPVLGLLLRKTSWTFADFSQARTALIIMSFSLALGLPQIVSRQILQGTGKHWYTSNALLISSLSSLLVTFVLLKLELGIIAPAVGWSTVWVLQGVVFLPWVITKHIGQSIGNMLRICYVPGVSIGVITFCEAFIVTRFVHCETLPYLFINLILTGMTLISAIIVFSGVGKRMLLFLKTRKISNG